MTQILLTNVFCTWTQEQAFCIFSVCFFARKVRKCVPILWDSIPSSCAYLQIQIKPQTEHIDFEAAMHIVLKTAFPEATIKCCRFHLGQACWRKIQTVGYLFANYVTPHSKFPPHC